MAPIGAMRERLTIETPVPLVRSITVLTRSGAVATATTLIAHGFATKDYLDIAGADQAYNGRVQVTVLNTLQFTFACNGALASPATGAITATYSSDAQGGRRVSWRTLATIPAEMIPLAATERLQLSAVQSDTTYRFRVRVRPDLEPKQRARWTPRWPPLASERLLEITGVLPIDNGLMYAQLECADSPVR